MKTSYATEPICDVKRPNFYKKNSVQCTEDDCGMGPEPPCQWLLHWLRRLLYKFSYYKHFNRVNTIRKERSMTDKMTGDASSIRSEQAAPVEINCLVIANDPATIIQQAQHHTTCRYTVKPGFHYPS